MNRRLILAALLGTSAIAAAAFAADYTVVMSKGPAGTMTVTTQPDGSRRTTYEYNDRGRGPQTVTDESFDAKGLPTRVTVKGVDYFKTPVDERFTLTGKEASWSSGADEGVDPHPGGKAYLPYAGTSEDTAVLARALLKAPGHELDLIPGGHGRIDKAAEQVVTGPGGAK